MCSHISAALTAIIVYECAAALINAPVRPVLCFNGEKMGKIQHKNPIDSHCTALTVSPHTVYDVLLHNRL